MEKLEIEILRSEELAGEASALSEIIAATVNDGAAIGFMLPFAPADGRTFLEGTVFPAVREGRRLLFVARLDGETVGTVQLDVALPPNQPHRCEVAKMMVHPKARRRGVGLALLRAVDEQARQLGKSLMTLDTRSGDKAEPLYRKAGFKVAGLIPDYALDPDGARRHATTYMYKLL